MDKKRKFLSDLKLYSDFLSWREDLNRYETWDEAVEEVIDTHRVKYSNKLDELTPHLDFAEKLYKEKYFLAAQRNLQFRGNDIFKHEFRMFNCLTMYVDRPSFFGNAFYLLLCGCGVGVNMMIPFVKRMPKIQKRTKGTKTYIIPDSIEGWATAAHILISSYLAEDAMYSEYQGYEIKFDYSRIRPKGAKVGRKFKAPGHEGLKSSFEKVENLLNLYLSDSFLPKDFKSIIIYDIFMHLSDAVLSGGVRRSACSIIVSPEDSDLVYAKSGNWRLENKQRERSNNSVGLIRGKFSKEHFHHFLELNKGVSDIGFVFLNNIFEVLNPCFEIGFTPLMFDYERKDIVQRIMESDETLLDEGLIETGIQCCNLNEINGGACKSEEEFYDACRAAAIVGTCQAGYTTFKHILDVLGPTIEISKKEALLGVSITGWANSPFLFNEEILKKGAEIVVETNKLIAEIIGINPSARSTTVKPSGNASVILGCASGIHPEHSENYFRVLQLNKDTETAKYLEESMPYLLEEGVYSANNTDYAVFVPVENEEGTMYKNDLQGVKHLELIKLVMNSWIKYGKVEERCIIPTTSHNVSNTVIIDDYDEITNYIFENQSYFTAVSFLSVSGDKDWNQSPNTSVLSFDKINTKYGEGSLFASGLIIDGLHAFDDNLWDACEAVTNKEYKITGDRVTTFIKKEWIRRVKKFAKNYFKSDLEETIYCLKDVHLLHKWKTISREFKSTDFVKILTEPRYIDIDTIGSIACYNGSCEI
jgi:ribonucleoside-triphosphate reductase